MLEAIDLDSLSSLGYAFQVEITYRAICAGFRVVEVPITFRDRRVGQSKMSRRDRRSRRPGGVPPDADAEAVKRPGCCRYFTLYSKSPR